MDIKDVKRSFERLKQRVLKTDGQKAAAEVNNIITAINEAIAERGNEDRYNRAIGKVFQYISRAEAVIKNSENLADINSIVKQIK